MESNIYADKSSLILDWLLRVGVRKPTFGLREVAKDTGVSVGLVQRVFASLVQNGFLLSEGVRTSKKFSLHNPAALLKSWLSQYSIVKKCKMRTYRSALRGRGEMLQALKGSDLDQKVALALHSAAEAHKCRNTNLNTLELYLLEPGIRSRVEEVLQLELQEKGYEVLLIEPYYKCLLSYNAVSPPLLTYLDLYHFPLRGQEQAEFMIERIPELKQIYKKR
ncbi:MAG TPA: type IV toxin-antitoxin system AbiEi family antitoxin [Chlamydiales bacterium]|nr:type IV toxin-antitoxin system AbiEi family antitoxin [Chlamydiales bacterium]